MTNGPVIEIRLSEALRTPWPAGASRCSARPAASAGPWRPAPCCPAQSCDLRPADIKCLPGG